MKNDNGKNNSGLGKVIKAISYKHLLNHKQQLSQLWNAHSGEWNWLKDEPQPLAALSRHLWRLAIPSVSFYFLLGISTIIATLGLIANSAAIIIGAMIIAPLMGPIISIAYAMAVGNRRLLRRSSLTLFTGIILTVVIAYLTCKIVWLRSPTSEILARTNSTLIDLGVALAAGAAGAYALSRRHIADALPGVAIAVALVPPLSTIGIGLAWGEFYIFRGATLLFSTNLFSIIFSSALIYLYQGYGKILKARKGLLILSIILVFLGFPLAWQMNQLLLREEISHYVEQLIRNQTLTFASKDIHSLQIKRQNKLLYVELEVATGLGTISQNQINLVKQFLEKRLDEPVDLKVIIMPIEVLDSEPSQP